METFKETQEMKRSVWSLLFVFIAASATIPVIIASQAEGKSWVDVWPAGLITVAVVVFFMALKLETTIDEKGVRVSFGFLSRKGKFYAWDEVKSVRVGEYNPLMEYGGWGYRIRPWKKRRAYSISGYSGLELTLHDGYLVMVGTKKSEAIATYLKYLHQKYGIEALKEIHYKA